ncbi:MAG TPA: hypothetical protein VMM93_05915 [Vicinamibacterales bacterium]|nr:hypothetical protein [Vicinamibacterales bacterium]
MSTATAHVTARVSCSSCHSAIELECRGLPGFWGYQSYNEYHCPACGKQNHARTTGAIVSARLLRGGERTDAGRP